jgi:hypothetical protein
MKYTKFIEKDVVSEFYMADVQAIYYGLLRMINAFTSEVVVVGSAALVLLDAKLSTNIVEVEVSEQVFDRLVNSDDYKIVLTDKGFVVEVMDKVLVHLADTSSSIEYTGGVMHHLAMHLLRNAVNRM